MPNLWRKGCGGTENNLRFFSIALCHNDLAAYFKLTFNLVQHQGHSLEDIENLIPWEKEVYINLLINHIKEEKEKIKNRTHQ